MCTHLLCITMGGSGAQGREATPLALGSVHSAVRRPHWLCTGPMVSTHSPVHVLQGLAPVALCKATGRATPVALCKVHKAVRRHHWLLLAYCRVRRAQRRYQWPCAKVHRVRRDTFGLVQRAQGHEEAPLALCRVQRVGRRHHRPFALCTKL